MFEDHENVIRVSGDFIKFIWEPPKFERGDIFTPNNQKASNFFSVSLRLFRSFCFPHGDNTNHCDDADYDHTCDDIIEWIFPAGEETDTPNPPTIQDENAAQSNETD
jgi:hypothetical protein